MEGSGSGDVVADLGSSRLYLVMTHDEEPAMLQIGSNSSRATGYHQMLDRWWITGE